MTDDIKKITDQYNLQELQANQARRLKKNFPVSIEEKLKDYEFGNHTVKKPDPEIKLEYNDALKASFHGVWKSLSDKPLIVTSHNAKIVRQVLRWITKLIEDEYLEDGSCSLTEDSAKCHCHRLDTKKGLYIWGDYGRGKSTFLAALVQSINKAANKVKSLPHFYAHDFKQMIETAKKDKNTNQLYRTKGCIGIDDFAWAEEGQLSIYGNDVNLISDVIYRRHKTWVNNRSKNRYERKSLPELTVFTSNISPLDLLEEHGEGVYSRLIEMCNILHWDGDKNFRL